MDLSALSAPHATLLAAVVTGLVGLIGIGVSNHRKYRHERLLKLLEARLAHVDAQIKHYYGPLHTLAQHIRIIHQTRMELINGLGASETPPDVSKIRSIVRSTWAAHFRPIHADIRKVIQTRSDLLGEKLPESFSKYLRHSIGEEMAEHLAAEHDLYASFDHVTRWNNEFLDDVEARLNAAFAERESLMQELDRDVGRTRRLPARDMSL